MNGIATITIHDGELQGSYILRFGMLGCHEFERRVLMNATPNNYKVLTDMIYGGLFGEAMRSELPVPDYQFAYDLFEALAEQDDFNEQAIGFQKVYEESKFGKEFIEKNKKYLDDSGKPEKPKKKAKTR